jgi:ATP-binding protein involved in chromosome partitioning
MTSNAITQLITETYWGNLDYLIIDFPPGTGDIQITTMQKFDIDGAIVVTTPQSIALNDARKGAEMLLNEKIGVPLLGIIENMSWFTPSSHPNEKYFIFGTGGGQRLAKELNVPLLAKIPLVLEVGDAVEHGLDLVQIKDQTVLSTFGNLIKSVINRFE